MKVQSHKMAFSNFGNLKKVFFLLIVVILLVATRLLDSNKDKKEKHHRFVEIKTSDPTSGSQPLFPRFLKVFHLDLKGAPPKLQFLLNVLPIINQSGANAILIEYEDMFPYSGVLKNISATNAYTLPQVRRLVQFAESLNMQVIPLVQTFGHLEYVLKLEQFRGLREVENFPQEICPSNKEAVELVKEMIKQCMAVHPKSKYIHIGCDEVRHVGACPKCSRSNPKKLFANHIIKMADFIRSQYPGVTPLVWDDMLRRWTFNDLQGLGSSVEPVVWVYGQNIFTLVPSFTWNIYERTFPGLWVASSFKGAFGETETLPNLTRHLENQLSWRRLLFEEEGVDFKKKISGIILTGWSRYDHFAVLCELLPVGIPSLTLSLTILDQDLVGEHSKRLSKWLRILRCPSNYIPSEVRNETFFQHSLGNCSFPGSNLYSAVIQFQRLKARVQKVVQTVELSGWTSQYNLDKNFTSPWRLMQMFPEEGFAGEALNQDLSDWKSTFLPVMGQYFDCYTSEEWEQQNIKPLEEKLAEIQRNFQKFIRKKTWPRRPLR